MAFLRNNQNISYVLKKITASKTRRDQGTELPLNLEGRHQIANVQ